MPETMERNWPGRSWGLPAWFAPVFAGLVVAVFCLIALGGSVRAMNAGLACPDWPLCFGDLIPDFNPQVYFEFIHRVAAGTISLVTLGLQILIFRSRAPRRLKIWGAATLGLLLAQIVFGGLTVLLQLQANVVATHLALGTGFFAALLWMYLSLKSASAPAERTGPGWLKGLTGFVTLAVYGQIIMGGLVASHFAALACTEFPQCMNGVWVPTMKGPIGIHLMHRFNAYFVFLVIVVSGLLLYKFTPSSRLKKLAGILFLAVCAQIGLGIANVLFYIPPIIAVAHLATATFILSIAVREFHLTTYSA